MSKPVHVVTDFKTHRGQMREEINNALPKRSPVLGIMIGFACTIAIVYAGVEVILARFAGG